MLSFVESADSFIAIDERRRRAREMGLSPRNFTALMGLLNMAGRACQATPTLTPHEYLRVAAERAA